MKFDNLWLCILLFCLTGNWFASFSITPDTLSNTMIFKEIIKRVKERDTLSGAILKVKSKLDSNIELVCEINRLETENLFNVQLYEPLDPFLDGRAPTQFFPNAEVYMFGFDSSINAEYRKLEKYCKKQRNGRKK